jgi:hypothetical protein
MACTSFEDCVNDPVQSLPAADSFKSLSSTAIFSINLALYIFYIALFIAVIWFILKGIISIINADSSESYEKFQGAITNAVFAAVGIVLLFSARFLFVSALQLIGITGAENVFTNEGFYEIFK